MRIILWLAAGMGAAAIGGAAAAQSAGVFIRQGGSPHGASAPGSGGHVVGGHGHFRPGKGHGRGHRHGRFGRGGPRFVHSYGFAGVGPVESVDPHGTGFFAGGGGRIRLRGGHPYYDYDRAYPYEWASTAGGRPDPAEEENGVEPRPRCTVENGVRVCRGWR